MIKIDDAIVEAKEFLKCTEIGTVLESSRYWIMYKKTDEVEVGGCGALISKDTGEIKPFILPDENNFDLLNKSKEVVI